MAELTNDVVNDFTSQIGRQLRAFAADKGLDLADLSQRVVQALIAMRSGDAEPTPSLSAAIAIPEISLPPAAAFTFKPEAVLECLVDYYGFTKSAPRTFLPSREDVKAFIDRFYSGPLEPEDLAEDLIQLHARVGGRTMARSLDTAMEAASDLYPEALPDVLASLPSRQGLPGHPQTKGYHDSRPGHEVSDEQLNQFADNGRSSYQRMTPQLFRHAMAGTAVAAEIDRILALEGAEQVEALGQFQVKGRDVEKQQLLNNLAAQSAELREVALRLRETAEREQRTAPIASGTSARDGVLEQQAQVLGATRFKPRFLLRLAGELASDPSELLNDRRDTLTNMRAILEGAEGLVHRTTRFTQRQRHAYHDGGELVESPADRWQEAYLAVAGAADHFLACADMSSFVAYAKQCINNAIVDIPRTDGTGKWMNRRLFGAYKPIGETVHNMGTDAPDALPARSSYGEIAAKADSQLTHAERENLREINVAKVAHYQSTGIDVEGLPDDQHPIYSSDSRREDAEFIRAHMLRLIDGLSEPRRLVVSLRFGINLVDPEQRIEPLTIPQITSRLGFASDGTTRSHLSRGLDALEEAARAMGLEQYTLRARVVRREGEGDSNVTPTVALLNEDAA